MKRATLHTIVFFSGLGVMSVEITASRLLAPHFGASLVVWSGLIGVVLVALSIGYPLGGWLADRIGPEKGDLALCLILWSAGLLILITPALLPVVVSWRLVSFLILGPPVLLLAMVLPLAGKAIIPDSSATGRGLGGLLLSSTLGSVLGTFLPVWVTIPRIGSRETFFLCGGILCLLAAIGFLRNRLFSLLLLGVALAVLLFSIRLSQPPRDASVIYEGESAYHFIRVVQGVVQGGDRSRLLMVNEGGGMQSYYHPDRYLTGYYWDVAALLPALNRSGQSFLFLGLGGGTGARIVHRYFPSIRLEGVEIDPMVTKIGNDFLGLDQVPIRAITADARVFLKSAVERYDFVMIDVYKDNRTIPFHLATREFFEEVKGRLSARGAVLMNVSTPSSGRRLTDLIENTVASVFPHVYKLDWAGRAELVLAFREPPSFEVPMETLPPDLAELVTTSLERLVRVEFRPDDDLSTDNRSSVEVLGALSQESGMK